MLYPFLLQTFTTSDYGSLLGFWESLSFCLLFQGGDHSCSRGKGPPRPLHALSWLSIRGWQSKNFALMGLASNFHSAAAELAGELLRGAGPCHTDHHPSHRLAEVFGLGGCAPPTGLGFAKN